MTQGRKPNREHLTLVSASPVAEVSEDNESDAFASNPPKFLSVRAQHHWREHVRSSPPGLLTQADTGLLAGYVQAMALYEDAMEKVNKLGQMVNAPKTKVPMHNPFVSLANQQMAMMEKLAKELGFSPSSRSRVQPKKGKRGRSPLGTLKNLKV